MKQVWVTCRRDNKDTVQSGLQGLLMQLSCVDTKDKDVVAFNGNLNVGIEMERLKYVFGVIEVGEGMKFAGQ